jgi:pimeloyl-ACP methyl ester carboxylesterase
VSARRASAAIVGAALDTIEGYALSPEIREDYSVSCDGERFVESMRHPRRYSDERPDPARRPHEIQTPLHIIAGRRDRVVPLANAEFLDARLPNSRVEIVYAGHFVWEKAADEYGSTVSDWVTGGYRTAAGTAR